MYRVRMLNEMTEIGVPRVSRIDIKKAQVLIMAGSDDSVVIDDTFIE